MNEVATRKDIADLTDILKDFISFTTEKFVEIDKRFDKIEKRLDKIEDRLDKIEDRLDKVEARLDKVESRLDKIENRLDHIEAHIFSNDTQIAGINERLYRMTIA